MMILKLTTAECQILLDSLRQSNTQAPRLERRLQALLTPPSGMDAGDAFERGRAAYFAAAEGLEDPTESPDYVTHENRFDPTEAL